MPSRSPSLGFRFLNTSGKQHNRAFAPLGGSGESIGFDTSCSASALASAAFHTSPVVSLCTINFHVYKKVSPHPLKEQFPSPQSRSTIKTV